MMFQEILKLTTPNKEWESLSMKQKGGIMNECLEAIENRRSIRKFKEKKVSESDIRTLLHAAHMAPSAIYHRIK